VPHAIHQLTQVGTRIGGELVTGMPQIVKVDHREPGSAKSWPPDAAAEVTEPQRATFGTGEHEPVVTGCGVGDDVRGKVGGDHLGEGHQALTGVRLGRPEGEAAATWLAQLPGDPDIPGTWAQIRIGAAIAHLLKDSLDGAIEQVTPMLAMAPEYRIATVTGWLADLDRYLSSRRYGSSPAASCLRQQIRGVTADALPPPADKEAR
jgi:hypothetical protein